MEEKTFIIKELQAWEKSSDKFNVIISENCEGVIDDNGNMVIPPEYDSISLIYNFNLIQATKADYFDLYFYDRRTYESVFKIKPSFSPDSSVNWKNIAWEYRDQEMFKIKVGYSDSKFGILGFDSSSGSTKFHIVLNPVYDHIQFFHDKTGFVKLEKDKLIGLSKNVSGNLKEVIPVKFQYIDFLDSNIIKVTKEDKVGYFDENGKQIIPFIYGIKSLGFKDNLAKVELGNRFGYINSDNEIIIPIVYRELGEFSEGYAVASKLIEIKTKNILGISSKKTKKLCGFLDSSGNIFVDFKYTYAESFQNGRAVIGLNGKFGYIDLNGNEYW